MTPGSSISFRNLCAPAGKERLRCIEDAVGLAINILVERRQHKQGTSEDHRSSDIVGYLQAMGFTATREEEVGGHVDIVIRQFDLLWLAEAKNWKGCAWAFRGLRQLLFRYATGLAGQNAGGLILYFEQKDAAGLMKKWRQRISSDKLSHSVDNISALSFRTGHHHRATGTKFSVRHFSVPLYWAPEI